MNIALTNDGGVENGNVSSVVCVHDPVVPTELVKGVLPGPAPARGDPNVVLGTVLAVG